MRPPKIVHIVTLWITIFLILVLKIRPELLSEIIPGQDNLIAKIIDVTFDFALVAFGTLLGVFGIKRLVGRPSSGNWVIPSDVSEAHGGHAEPCRRFVIYGKIDGFCDDLAILTFLKRSVILSGHHYTITASFSEAEDLLRNSNYTGVISSNQYKEQFLRTCKGTSSKLVIVKANANNQFQDQAGDEVTTVELPEQYLDHDDVLYHFAKILTAAFSLDTPRGVGFHGNWCGTYGLMALTQNKSLEVGGVYWYGRGELSGRCYIDIDEQLLILVYKWSQSSNDGHVGSREQGEGVFVIPAGYEFFYGYWHDLGDNHISQSWCGARLSQDISESIIENRSPFGADFGFSQHPREKLISWRNSPILAISNDGQEKRNNY